VSEEYTLDWSQSKVFLVYNIHLQKIMKIVCSRQSYELP